MPTAILTLQLPRGGRGIPVATTADPQLLRQFKRTVLLEWETKIETARDEFEALLAHLELERLEKALAVIIPEPDENIDAE